MKSIIRVIAALILAVNIGCTPNFCRSDAPDCLGRLVGTYHGQAYAPGDLQPTLTSFYLDEKGNLKGKYFINYMQYDKDPAVNYWDGEIIDIKPLAEYMMWATWSDRNGKSNLRLVFSFDGSEFAGYWGFGDGDNSNPWYGKKVSDKPTITVKDLEELLGIVPVAGTETKWPSKGNIIEPK